MQLERREYYHKKTVRIIKTRFFEIQKETREKQNKVKVADLLKMQKNIRKLGINLAWETSLLEGEKYFEKLD